MNSRIYTEEQRQIYLKLIEKGVTKEFLSEDEEFIIKKRFGYQETNFLKFDEIRKQYNENSRFKDKLSLYSIREKFNSSLIKIKYRLDKFGYDQLIYFFSTDGLKHRKNYINNMSNNNSLDQVRVSFLGLEISLERKLCKAGYNDLNSIICSSENELRRLLYDNDYKILKNKLDELGIFFKNISLNNRKFHELTESEKMSLSVNELFSLKISNCLHRINVNNLRELLNLNYYQLCIIRNLGKKSIDEIINKIHGLGYKISGDEDHLFWNEKSFTSREFDKFTLTERKNIKVRCLFPTIISQNLENASINTIGDILERDCKELVSINNIGFKSVQKILKKINKLGFHIKGEEEFTDSLDDDRKIYETVPSLKNINLSKEINDAKSDIFLNYRDLLEQYRNLKIEQGVLDYQIECVTKELDNIQIRGKKYEK